MPKNDDLLRAINNPHLDGGDAEVRNRALDCLIRANPATNFRNAVVEGDTYWRTFGNLMQAPQTRNWILPNTPVSGYFDTDAFLDPANDAFTTIQQNAAEQRVKSSLSAITDQEVLKNILKHNPEQCKAYLATKVSVITESLNWGNYFQQLPAAQGQSAPPPTSSSPILTPQAVINIKKQAAEQHLGHLIGQVRNPQLLAQLLAAQDGGQLKTAMEGLGFPTPTNPANILEQLTQELTAQATTQKNLLVKDAAIAECKRKLTAYEENVSSEFLLTQEVELGKDSHLYLASLLNSSLEDPNKPYKEIVRNLPQTEQHELIKATQQLLSQRYLQAYLVKKGMDVGDERDKTQNRKKVFEASNANLMKEALAQSGLNPIINNAIPDDSNIQLYKIALAKNIISKLSLNAILKLEKDNLQTFQADFGSFIGTSANFIAAEDLPALKREVRARHFQLELDNRPLTFGAQAHSELIKVFNQLSDKQQNELLSKPEKLDFILKARHKDVLQHYLGSDIALDALLQENKRFAVFKGINNPGIARVLAGYQPPIELTYEQVDQINERLIWMRTRILNDIRHYNRLITNYIYETIKTNNAINVEDLRQAFGVQSDGKAFAGQKNTANSVSEHHNSNRTTLYKNLANPKSGFDRLFYSIWTRTIKPYPLDKVALTAVKEYFKHSVTVEEFIDKVLSRPPQLTQEQKKVFKAQLSTEFTPAVYRELRAEYDGEKFLAAADDVSEDSGSKQMFLEHNSKLSLIQSEAQKIIKHSEALKLFMQSVKTDWSFNKTSAKSQRQNYLDLKDECDQIIEHLNSKWMELEALKKATPLPGKIRNDEAREEILREVDELHRNIAQAQNEISSQLKIYKTHRKKLVEHIIPDLEAVISGTKVPVYQDKETKVKFYAISRSQLSTTAIRGETRAAPPTQIADRNAPKERLTSYESLSSSGTVGAIDMKFVDGKEARYFLDPDDKSYKIDKFPPQAGPRPDPAELVHQVEYTMHMAMNALLNLEGPAPSTKAGEQIPLIGGLNKELETQLLWAALITLGETPEMHFTPDAILVSGQSGFNPENHIERWGRNNLRGKPRLADASPLKDVFDDKNPHTGAIIKRYKEEFSAKLKERKEVEKLLDNTTKVFKDRLDVNKKDDIASKAKKTIADEGVTMGHSNPPPRVS